MSLGLALVLAYLLGGIPFAVIAGRLRGIDVLRAGSGNPGATNAIRLLGPAVGIPVLLADAGKGLAGVLLCGRIAGGSEGAGLACGAAAILGHVFPLALRFKGGKGVATAAGVFLAVAPAATGIAVGFFVVVLLAFRYVSAASMAAAIALPVALNALGASRLVLAVGGVVALLVLVRHRANLGRLLAGTESRVRFGSRNGAAS